MLAGGEDVRSESTLTVPVEVRHFHGIDQGDSLAAGAT